MSNKNKLGLVFFPAFDWAISKTHPEREERLLYTKDQIIEEGIEDVDNITFFNPKLAKVEDIQRVHFMVPDVKTRLSQSHFISSGGSIEAFDKVFSKEVDKSFALIRPPGHHAHRVVYGDRGFCIVNNEAVALEAVRQKYGDFKAVIVDTDAHHGDGTQDIYYNDKDTLVISFHQDGRTLYPGSGSIEEFGGPSAYGYNINIPLPPETGEEGFLYILEEVVMPIIEDYKPDLIINSAGQDNHYSDPLTNMNFTAHGYAVLNKRLNPDIAVLEGGYSIQSALPYINLGIILAMADMDFSNVIEPDYDKERIKQKRKITKHIESLSALILNRWENKEKLAKKKFKGKEKVERKRQIYYDTDAIMEEQTQTFYLCDKCFGIDTTKSKNDRLDNIFAISIPRNACNECEKKAYKLYEEKEGFTNTYLQDKKNDKYFSK